MVAHQHHHYLPYPMNLDLLPVKVADLLPVKVADLHVNFMRHFKFNLCERTFFIILMKHVYGNLYILSHASVKRATPHQLKA